jgi:hypothetical protein
MKQVDDEHRKVEALEQKLQELKDLHTKQELSQEFQQALLKINTAIKLIDKIQPGQKRDRTIETIKQTCAEDITLLKNRPNLRSKICSMNQTMALILQD